MQKLTKKKLLYCALLICFGFSLGIVVSVYIFAIDVDVLAVPYINKGVKITKNMTAVQGKVKLHVQSGTQMLLTRRLPNSNEYCILVNSSWDNESNIEELGAKPQYFEVK